MVKLVQEENLQLDVVSEGELYTALESGLMQIVFTFTVIIKLSEKFNTH